MKFGLNVDPNTGGLAIAERIAAIADDGRPGVRGHPGPPYNAGFTDTLRLITWLAARTGRVHLFPNVANLPLRPPAMLAKQAASIDVLSGGRFELGLGAGAFADGIAGMGGPGARRARPAARSARPSTSSGPAGPGNRTATGAPTTNCPASGPGRRPRTRSACGSAWPARARSSWSAPRPTAGRYPRPTCRRTGCPGSTRSSTARPRPGRDPAAITRLYNVMGLITPEDRDPFNGPVGRWAQTLTTLHTDGADERVRVLADRDRERQSRLFAEEVVPAARESLARLNAAGPG